MTHSIDRLYDAVLEAMDAHPSSSRTARFLRAGRSKIAKKVTGGAVEVVIEAMLNHRDAVVRESAGFLYNLAVLWASVDVEPKEACGRKCSGVSACSASPKSSPSNAAF